MTEASTGRPSMPSWWEDRPERAMGRGWSRSRGSLIAKHVTDVYLQRSPSRPKCYARHFTRTGITDDTGCSWGVSGCIRRTLSPLVMAEHVVGFFLDKLEQIPGCPVAVALLLCVPVRVHVLGRKGSL